MNIITSYGIILISKNKSVLLGKRISSLQYFDIFNCRCPLSKVETYVAMCSPEEKEILRLDDFDNIFYDAFSGHRDYNDVLGRWKKIRPYVQSALKKGLTITPSCMYSFPKGKKKPGEDPEEAALREFEEETTISRNQIRKTSHHSYNAYFKGSDDKSYKTTYYIYECDEEIIVPKKYFNTPFPNRQYRASAEMQELFWIPVGEIGNYLERCVAGIVDDLTCNQQT